MTHRETRRFQHPLSLSGNDGRPSAWLALPALLVLLITAVLPFSANAEEILRGSKNWKLAELLITNEHNAWTHYAKRDLEASGRLVAKDYGDVQADGSVLDRAGHLAFVPEANVEWHKLDHFHVFRLSPDAAVVTYRARSRDRGAKEEYAAAVTSGWSRRDGAWINTFYRETETAVEVEAEADAEKKAGPATAADAP